MLARFGSTAGSIFTTGPSMTSCQSGRIAATAVDQLEVQALVDHAVEAEARPRDRRLVFGSRSAAPGAREMGDVDAAGEGMDVRMQMALGLEQAHAAGEDEIRAREQRPLERGDLRRRAAERG